MNFLFPVHCSSILFLQPQFHCFIAVSPTLSISLIRDGDGSVGIATDYGRDDRMTGVRNQAGGGARNFSPRHRLQTGSGAHPASYPLGIGGISPSVERPGRETDDSM
jgi:hypothetical protein